MDNEERTGPDTDFGDGGVGGEKGFFFGTDRGLVSDEQRLPEEPPLAPGSADPVATNDGAEGTTSEPDRSVEGGGDSRLLDDARHSGLGGGEASR